MGSGGGGGGKFLFLGVFLHHQKEPLLLGGAFLMCSFLFVAFNEEPANIQRG